jgi:hypothetical protein
MEMVPSGNNKRAKPKQEGTHGQALFSGQFHKYAATVKDGETASNPAARRILRKQKKANAGRDRNAAART